MAPARWKGWKGSGEQAEKHKRSRAAVSKQPPFTMGWMNEWKNEIKDMV